MFVQLSYSVRTMMPETHDTPVHPIFCYKTDQILCSSSYKGNILSHKPPEILRARMSTATY